MSAYEKISTEVVVILLLLLFPPFFSFAQFLLLRPRATVFLEILENDDLLGMISLSGSLASMEEKTGKDLRSYVRVREFRESWSTVRYLLRCEITGKTDERKRTREGANN